MDLYRKKSFIHVVRNDKSFRCIFIIKTLENSAQASPPLLLLCVCVCVWHMCEFMLVAGKENVCVCSAAVVCVSVFGKRLGEEGRTGRGGGS